ncbi:MAG: outer membrane beta-barrel protein [Pseudomonadota bacterium]
MSLRTCRLRALTPTLFVARWHKPLLRTFAAASLITITTQVFAADIADGREIFAPAPQVLTQSSRWSGIYAGLGVSAVLRHTEIERGAGNAKFSEGVATITPSLYAGYNFVGPGNFIWGFEGDVVFTGKGTTFTDPTLGTFERRGNFLGTARVRAGVEAGRALLYATGGLAVTNFEIRPSTVVNSDVNWRAGVAVGAGAEYAINDRWALRGEGIYTHFGKNNDIAFSGTERRVKKGLARSGSA